MPDSAATPILTVAMTSRALFDMEDSHSLFEASGIEAYAEHQRAREDEVLEPGIAFPLARKLLALNEGAPPDAPRVEVILVSRNSSDTGLRVFNSIQHHGLPIWRASFTSGAPTWPYIKPFGAQLFLSANPESVRNALAHGIAAATILPAKAMAHRHDQLRIAFDGDAVISATRASGCRRRAASKASTATSANTRARCCRRTFRGFLDALHTLQAAFPPGESSPIRTALVTARSAPAHERVIRTLREWGIRLDEALFLGGRPKGPFLDVFGADIFFDDSLHNIDSARCMWRRGMCRMVCRIRRRGGRSLVRDRHVRS